MKRASIWSRMALVSCLLLHAACATSRARPAGGTEPQAVRTSPLPGDRLKLSFEPVTPNPAHEVLRREEAQAVLAAFYTALLEERPRIQVLAPSWLHSMEAGAWEQRLRVGFESRFGLPLVPTAKELKQSHLFRALKMSPQYMGQGVREAALEMFASP